MAYAQPADLRGLIGHLTDTIDLPEDGSDEALGRLLQRASADLDGFLHIPLPLDPVDPEAPLAPDRLDVATLSRYEVQGLKLATCAQAVYRCLRDETELAEGAPSVVAAGGVTFANVAPERIGPEALYCLSAIPTLWWHASGTVAPDPPPPTTWIDPVTGETVTVPALLDEPPLV